MDSPAIDDIQVVRGMRGIAGRLAVFISLVALVATASVGYMVYSGAEESLIEAASERVSHTAETVSVRVWGRIASIGDDMHFFAETPAVKGLIRAKRQRGGLDPNFAIRTDEWGAQLAEMFRSLLESRSSYLQVRFFGLANDGKELVGAHRRNGRAEFATSAELSTHGDTPFVREAAELPPGGMYLSEVVESDGDRGIPAGTPVIYVSTPIHTDDGKPFGALVVTIDVGVLLEPLESIVEPNQTLYVANSKGDLLHMSGRGATGDVEAMKMRWERLLPSLSDLIAGSPTEIRMLDARLGAETRGIAYFEEVALDSRRERSKLLVGVTEPHETILAGVRRVRNQSAFITILLSLAALGAALMASRYLTKPLRQITTAVTSFGGDGDKVSLPVDRSDEIGLLARAFEAMGQQIEDQIGVLEDEERRQRTILETSAEGIIVADADGRIEAFNPASEVIFGVASERVVGQHLGALMPRRTVASLLHPPESEGTPGTESVGRRADGTKIPISIFWSEFEWRNERKLTVFVQDISERKEAERSRELLVQELETERERLRKLSLTLEERVRERTIDLERLNRELESTNRELREIASVASHDLQEPLRKLRAFADLLSSEYNDVLDEGGRFYTQRIFRISERMSKLINDLLAFSGVVSKGAPYKKVDLSGIAADVIADLHGTIKDAEARIELEPLPEVEADPIQMRELFEQIIDNAILYRRPDVPPCITIRGSVQNDHVDGSDGTLCILEFEDNGIGFDEKYAGRIFAPFERLAGRVSSEGTGMGLTICRRIAENHRGSIIARSRPGSGSTFVVTLPVRQPSAPLPVQTSATRHPTIPGSAEA